MKDWAALAIPAALWWTAGCGGHALAPARKTIVPVRTTAVEQISFTGEMRYSAHIKPNQVLPLAFKYGGFIDSILQVRGVDGVERLVQEGDAVAKGAVLARLRAKDFQVKVNQARALLSEAQASLGAVEAQAAEAAAARSQAATDHARAQRLFEGKSLTNADLQRAKTGLDMADARVAAARGQIEAVRARLTAAREQLAEAETALADSAITAPIDGVILKRMAEPGTLTGPGNPAFILGDIGTVKATMGVPDTAIHTIRMGDRLTLLADALPGQTFTGQVTQIAVAADPKSHLFDVELTIPNPKRALQVGMIASVRMSAAKDAGTHLSLPLSSVILSPKTPNKYAVFVVEARGSDQIAALREVELGQAAGNAIAVAAGVRAGERIITSGSNLVSDGEPVRVVP